jgi:hypothetical protein
MPRQAIRAIQIESIEGTLDSAGGVGQLVEK